MTDRDHLAFTLAVHRAVAPDPARPACWSPYSVASALGLTTQAAGGATRAELLTLLVGTPGGDVRKQAELLTAAAHLDPGHAAEPPVLAVANTLWARDDLPVHADFAAELAAWPDGRVRPAPFGEDPEAARALINADVAGTTRDLIPELVPRGAVDRTTVAALVNALYLRTGWRHAFLPRNTTPEPFHAPGGTRAVPTMRDTAQFGYAARSGWQVVSLPAHGDVAAVVLLPDTDLAAAEAELDADLLGELLAAPTATRIELHLPKFEASASVGLDGPLRELGVRTLFTNAADLTGLAPGLTVSAVLHQAVLRVDEAGLEGAAATAVMVAMAMAVRQAEPPVVRVDRPFLIAVRHVPTGAIYFLARIVSP